MSEVLILTGNCGVGKSTVAKAWAYARAGAAIAADDMHLWIRVKESATHATINNNSKPTSSWRPFHRFV